jgi:hypothetical protein
MIAATVMAFAAPAASAQGNPVITSVTFEAGAPNTLVGTVNLSSSQVSAGCTNAYNGSKPAITCATSINVGGGISPRNGAFVLNGAFTSITYNNSAPGNGCNNVTVNIRLGTNVIYSGCKTSGQFTVAIKKDGSVAITQN